MSKTRTELVGHVFVDAGLIWVGDPCYILGDDATHRVREWIDFCGLLPDRNVNVPLGDGTGLAISSGFGDGSYPVYVEFSDEGAWGERVSKITIDFQLGEE